MSKIVLNDKHTLEAGGFIIMSFDEEGEGRMHLDGLLSNRDALNAIGSLVKNILTKPECPDVEYTADVIHQIVEDIKQGIVPKKVSDKDLVKILRGLRGEVHD